MRCMIRLFSVALPLVCFSLANATPAGAASSANQPDDRPGIFGVGFTNITDSSARLVFTTSEPMSASIDVMDDGKTFFHLSEPTSLEIHSLVLEKLAKGKAYRVVISATGKEGAARPVEVQLNPALRPASRHAWPGYTIFSSTVNGNHFDAGTLDLLARSGARMDRIEISWDGVYPQRGRINHAYLDQMLTRVAELKKRGIEPLVVLDYCVAWAKHYTDTTMTWRNRNFGPPDDLADWEQYVRTVVTALHGSARYFEIWNEPDAGYLATGSFVERPNLPAPIGRPPFKDNWDYWIGDRYAPMVDSARKVLDELQPDALLMNGGWNRDYSGQRGDVLLQRGTGSAMDIYAYHVYSHSPASFSRWYKEVDGGFRQNIDRIFAKNDVRMPLAVTEWGWPAWVSSPEGKGFVTYHDAQLFYLKSTFYFLGMERFEVLSQFCLGLGSSSRDRDPLFFMLVNDDENQKVIVTPVYQTFQWLANTFGSQSYRALPVEAPGSPAVKAYAIQMKDSHDIYLAAWQDGPVDDQGVLSPLAARTVNVSIGNIRAGKYRVSLLDIDGKVQSTNRVSSGSSLTISVPLPEAGTKAESGIYLAKIGYDRQR